MPTAVTNICLNRLTLFINLTFRRLQHISSEVIIIQLQIYLNLKIQMNCELMKLIGIKRQEIS